MSEIIQVKSVLEAEDRVSAVVKRLQAQVDKLAKSLASLAKINTTGLKAALAPAGADKVARALAQTEAIAMHDMGTRFALEGRLGWQRAAEDARKSASAGEVATMRDFRRPKLQCWRHEGAHQDRPGRGRGGPAPRARAPANQAAEAFQAPARTCRKLGLRLQKAMPASEYGVRHALNR